ncbi:hypothetical protein CHS0354_030935 [Potamilus streckersoni]|uniref:Uncharacterized protein n=1 Tax=Potamilus streckersoni TaxID=2493646 RepID=A0AAE0VM75_9BIVA|nr:hypothetical protein CHS0354_030935 [Potamilus streckersoni]
MTPLVYIVRLSEVKREFNIEATELTSTPSHCIPNCCVNVSRLLSNVDLRSYVNHLTASGVNREFPKFPKEPSPRSITTWDKEIKYGFSVGGVNLPEQEKQLSWNIPYDQHAAATFLWSVQNMITMME